MQPQKQFNNQNRVRTNNQIRVPQVRVILEDGTSLGILSTYDALKKAKELGLDLVEVNAKASPPVCKILDYGKFKYEEKKKAVAAKKNQKQVELKEITFRPNIDENDLNHKIAQAREFLLDSKKVQFTVRFAGREITHLDIGKEKLEMVIKSLSDIPVNISQTFLEGKKLSLTVSPK